MSKQEIETFSLDTVTQEEKDFLVYMYGNDLEKVSGLNSREISWWVKAFQDVKAGKRPKFNWSAFFLSSYWCLRKKNFKLGLLLNLYTIIFIVVILCLPEIMQNVHLDFLAIPFMILMMGGAYIPMILSGFFGAKTLINNYLLKGSHHRVGRLPFTYLYPLFFIEIISKFFKYLPLSIIVSLVSLTYAIPCLLCLYTIILMKFWLPAKKISEA